MNVIAQTTGEVVYFTHKLYSDLLQVIDDVFSFANSEFSEEITCKVGEAFFMNDFSKELRQYTFHQLMNWAVFCVPITAGRTIYELFLQRYWKNWKNKSTRFKEVLNCWTDLCPGFYIIQHANSNSGKVFGFMDIHTGENKVVCNFSNSKALNKDETVTGLLMPMGDDSYITLGNLVHVPIKMKRKLLGEIIPALKEHAYHHQIPPHTYPALITLTLKQLETHRNQKTILV